MVWWIALFWLTTISASQDVIIRVNAGSRFSRSGSILESTWSQDCSSYRPDVVWNDEMYNRTVRIVGKWHPNSIEKDVAWIHVNHHVYMKMEETAWIKRITTGGRWHSYHLYNQDDTLIGKIIKSTSFLIENDFVEWHFLSAYNDSILIAKVHQVGFQHFYRHQYFSHEWRIHWMERCDQELNDWIVTGISTYLINNELALMHDDVSYCQYGAILSERPYVTLVIVIFILVFMITWRRLYP